MRGSTRAKEKTRSADVIAFPARKPGADKAAAIPAAPMTGERPTLLPPAVREWLRVALIVSIALHAIIYLLFQLRFADDLERASGATAAATAEGTVMIVPVEVVVETTLPAATAPTNATKPEAKVTTPTLQAEAAKKPAAPGIPVSPTAAEAPRPALPEEALAPPRAVETAKAPEAPAAKLLIEEKRKTEPARETPEREASKSARASPSTAAAPARAAANHSDGRAGASGEAESGGRAAVSSYQAQVLAHLSRHRIYPPEASSRGITGVATVRFALASNGQVLSSALALSSGAALLDEAAVAMVRRASPFPPFPPGLGHSRMDFAAPIRFDLR